MARVYREVDCRSDRVVDPAARAWLPCGALTVGSDGFLSGDAMLPLLGTVALVGR